MAKKQTLNTAAIFKNKNKEIGSAQPDYRGFLNVDGKDFEISCWVNETKDKEKYFSCKIKEPYQKQEAATLQKPEQKTDDLPF